MCFILLPVVIFPSALTAGTDLYQLLDPFTMLKRYVLFYGVRTQAELDDLFEPAEFMLSEHYASLLKSLGTRRISHHCSLYV